MKKANPLAIGIFVVGAAILTLTGIIILGAGKFFQNKKDYICFFNETVNGLDIGAPVKYKGVTVGKVNKIMISNSTDLKTQKIMVSFSVIEHKEIRINLDGDDEVPNFAEKIAEGIEEGLRAKLAYQSFVTGMLYLELDYFAAKNEKIEYVYAGEEYEEIPTIASSGIAEFSKKFANIADDVDAMGLAEIGKNLNELLVRANKKLGDVDTKAINEKTLALLDETNKILADRNIKKSMEKLTEVLDSVNSLTASAEKDLNKLTNNSAKTMKKMDNFLDNVNALLSRHSPFMSEFSLLLTSMKNTLQTADSFMEYLDRNPSALIKGKAPKNIKE